MYRFRFTFDAIMIHKLSIELKKNIYLNNFAYIFLFKNTFFSNAVNSTGHQSGKSSFETSL